MGDLDVPGYLKRHRYVRPQNCTFKRLNQELHPSLSCVASVHCSMHITWDLGFHYWVLFSVLFLSAAVQWFLRGQTSGSAILPTTYVMVACSSGKTETMALITVSQVDKLREHINGLHVVRSMRKHKHAHTHDVSTVLKELWVITNFILSIYLFLRLQRSEDEGTARM